MKLYIDRNNIQVELIRFRKKNSDFIAVAIFVKLENCYEIGLSAIREVSPPFDHSSITSRQHPSDHTNGTACS